MAVLRNYQRLPPSIPLGGSLGILNPAGRRLSIGEASQPKQPIVFSNKLGSILTGGELERGSPRRGGYVKSTYTYV